MIFISKHLDFNTNYLDLWNAFAIKEKSPKQLHVIKIPFERTEWQLHKVNYTFLMFSFDKIYRFLAMCAKSN